MRNRKRETMSHPKRALKAAGRPKDTTPSKELARLNRIGALLLEGSKRDEIRRQLTLLELQGKLDKYTISSIKPPDYISPETIAYIVDISRKTDLIRKTEPAWREALSLIASVSPEMPYGVLKGPQDLAVLVNMMGFPDETKPSTWTTIDWFLQDRAKEAVADIKRRLGMKLGRPRDINKTRIWARGAELNRARYSWAKITRLLDPEGYAADRKGAMDRMRLGITAYRKKHSTKLTPEVNQPMITSLK